MEASNYEEFEPFSTWRREQERDTLEIHLPGFKKQQLRVQINNVGVLKVSGEQPVNQKIQKRFYKEYKIPKDCNTDTIQAKFSTGILHVIMPKKTVAVTPQKKRTLSKQFEDDKNPNSAASIQDDQITYERNSREAKLQNTTNSEFSTGNSTSRLRRFVNVGISVGVALVLAIGAYIVYKYKSTNIDEEELL